MKRNLTVFKFLFFISLLQFVTTNSTNGQITSKSQFSIGFEKGFKEGYCYNTKSIYCDPQLVPITPLTRLNESEQSYQDGFNRGFQTGLDLQRLESGGGTSSPYGVNYSSIPNYKFNDYVPQIPLNAYVNALAYREALFTKRVQWVQQRIDGIYDLASNLLSQEGYNKIQTSMFNTRGYINSRKDLDDFSDDRVIAQIASYFKTIEREVYDIYKAEAIVREENERKYQFNNLLTTAFDSLNSNPQMSLRLVQEAESMNIESNEINRIKYLAYWYLGETKLALEYIDKYTSSSNLTHSNLQYLTLAKGTILMESGNFADGLTQLNNPILNNVDDTLNQLISFYKSKIYYGLNDYQSTLFYANKYLTSKPVNLETEKDIIGIMQLKAASLRGLGRYQEALDIINLAIKENNSTPDPSLYDTKGKIYFKMKDYKSAVNEFIKCTLLDDKYAESFYYLGLCYKNLNMKTKACETLLKAVKLGNPDALEEYPKFCK